MTDNSSSIRANTTTTTNNNNENELKKDIDLIISELVRPILYPVVAKLVREKVALPEPLWQLMNIDKIIEESISEGLAHAKEMLYTTKREKLASIIKYLVEKYSTASASASATTTAGTAATKPTAPTSTSSSD
ncbi:MAG: hypothetical protein QXI43_00215 [Candidatus Nitrosocaldus sp.]